MSSSPYFWLTFHKQESNFTDQALSIPTRTQADPDWRLWTHVSSNNARGLYCAHGEVEIYWIRPFSETYQIYPSLSPSHVEQSHGFAISHFLVVILFIPPGALYCHYIKYRETKYPVLIAPRNTRWRRLSFLVDRGSVNLSRQLFAH